MLLFYRVSLFTACYRFTVLPQQLDVPRVAAGTE